MIKVSFLLIIRASGLNNMILIVIYGKRPHE